MQHQRMHMLTPTCDLLATPAHPHHLTSSWDASAPHMLHGGGVDVDTCNRWFDKSYSLIFGTNGCFGVNIEHSAADGGPLLQIADFIIAPPFKDSVADFG